MGMIAVKPGMVRAREILDQHIAELDAAIVQERPPATFTTEVLPQQIRPAKALLLAAGSRGWAGMTSEERSAEMKRRLAMRKKSSAQTRWGRATPEQREKWQKAMKAGWRKRKRREQSERAVENARRAVEQQKQQPVVKLEATA